MLKRLGYNHIHCPHIELLEIENALAHPVHIKIRNTLSYKGGGFKCKHT